MKNRIKVRNIIEKIDILSMMIEEESDLNRITAINRLIKYNAKKLIELL